MIDVQYVTVDGIDFIFTDEITLNDFRYIFAVGEDDDNSMMILKEVVKDGEKCLVTISDEEEIEYVMEMFNKENN